MQNQLVGPCVSELIPPEKAALGRNCDFRGFWVWGIENPGEAPKTPGMGSIGGSGGLGGASPKGIREKGTPKREPGPRYHFGNGDRCPAQEKTPPIGPAELIVARQHDGHDRFTVVTRTDDGDDANTFEATGCHQEHDGKFEVIRRRLRTPNGGQQSEKDIV